MLLENPAELALAELYRKFRTLPQGHRAKTVKPILKTQYVGCGFFSDPDCG